MTLFTTLHIQWLNRGIGPVWPSVFPAKTVGSEQKFKRSCTKFMTLFYYIFDTNNSLLNTLRKSKLPLQKYQTN